MQLINDLVVQPKSMTYWSSILNRILDQSCFNNTDTSGQFLSLCKCKTTTPVMSPDSPVQM